MSKRPVLDLTVSQPQPRPTPAEPPQDEPIATIYCRCPQSVAEALRDIAYERSRGRRRRVSVNELVVQALREFIARNA